jgi:hypothetical protein
VAVEMIWLQDKTPDLDALTDLSRLSMGPSVPSSSNMHYQVGLSCIFLHPGENKNMMLPPVPEGASWCSSLV